MSSTPIPVLDFTPERIDKGDTGQMVDKVEAMQIKLEGWSASANAFRLDTLEAAGLPLAGGTLVGALTVEQTVTAEIDLAVGQDLSVGRDLSVGQDADVTRNAVVGQDLSVGRDLAVTGATSAAGDVTIAAADLILDAAADAEARVYLRDGGANNGALLSSPAATTLRHVDQVGATTVDLALSAAGLEASAALAIEERLSVGGASAAGAELRLHEASGNGTSHVALRSASAMSADYSVELPAAAGAAGETLQIASVSGSTLELEWGEGGGNFVDIDSVQSIVGHKTFLGYTTIEATLRVDGNVTSVNDDVTFAKNIRVKGNGARGAEVKLEDRSGFGGQTVAIRAANDIGTSYVIVMPSSPPTVGQILKCTFIDEDRHFLSWANET